MRTLEEQVDKAAEIYSYAHTVPHMGRTEPAWHYTIEDYIAGATSPHSPLLKFALEQLEQAAYEIGEGLAVVSAPRINRARLGMEKTLKEIRECMEKMK